MIIERGAYSMRKTIPVAKENFKQLIEDNYYYVDKTEVLENLLKNGTTIALFPRPRRFGKSLFMSMLENFFDIDLKETNKELFKDLYISKSPYYKELSKYPVIKLDFKDMKCDTFESFFNQLKIHISRIYEQKRYVTKKLKESELEIFNSITKMEANRDIFAQSIKYLSEWLERYHNEKVIILIDEYDAPLSEAYIKGFYEEVMSIIRKIFSSSLKGNSSLKMGVVTGVLRIGGENLFSDFNNPQIFDMMSTEYNEYFGFTEKETKELLEYYGLELTSDVKDYYNGYSIGGISIYNPWSILNYAYNKRLIPYWLNTSSNLLIKKGLEKLNEMELKEIENILQGGSISFNYDDRLTYKDYDSTNFEKTLNLLFASGYLTLDTETTSDITGSIIRTFKIPNYEVKKELINIVQTIALGRPLIDTVNYEKFLRNLLDENIEEAEKFLNEILMTFSFNDTYQEYFYHTIMTTLFAGFLNKNYIVKSNRESGHGRSDILIERVDRKFGLVMEIKISKNEDTEKSLKNGQNQLKEKEYYKELVLDKVEKIYQYVIVFHDKTAIIR